eukprot:CAMPEP_0115683060 /NCGR_PEP_ID=MMETSP0272-20121206/58187_1 /TAXON_ID=71861 /ORGANISM="Scrippsiella trochoidea, Strain CCMP3099" /LENGTH=218 /DNA_ID=CAMNT_0003122479 /DNA_START=1 /DNA_END=654 /DNA_ORIENTATION=+
MTRGLVVVLGSTGANFAAGMSGGLAYLLDIDRTSLNMESVLLESVDAEDCNEELVSSWDNTVTRFTKVFPKEYKKALESMKSAPAGKNVSDDKPAIENNTKDLEDLRPNSVHEPHKKRGFHEYARKSMSYRPDKDRTMDWEEIYASQTKKSQQWHSWMQTQTARCMDCGTPTCHSPNQGGGGCPLGNRIPTWNQLVHEGEWKRALERLLDTNNFPEFT